MQIAQLGFTSVKGMAHAALPRVELTPSGPRGDRVFCVVDASGEVLRTVRDNALMACRATWRPPVLTIETPVGDATGEVGDGDAITASYWGRPVDLVAIDGPWSLLLSRYLGRRVRLCRVTSPGAVVWSGSVSIVTTSSLAEVAQRIGRQVDDGARFRSTVVVDTGTGAPFVEDTWVGRRLRLGAAVVRISGRMPRCAVVNRRPGEGGPDADVVAALAVDRVGDAGIMFGVHGDVEQPGWIALGDSAEVALGCAKVNGMDETRVVSAHRSIAASAERVFELLADPSAHARIDGNDNVASAPAGQRIRGVGEVFVSELTVGSTRENHVIEFEEGRCIAWRPAEPGGTPPGHLWRWQLEPDGDTATRVTHTYDWSRLTDEARFARARATTADRLQASLDRLARLVEPGGNS